MKMNDVTEQLMFATRCRDQYFKGLLEEYRLRPSDLDVLMFLALHPDIHTAREICDDRLIAKSLVSASVDALVSRGLISRETDPTDRRRTLLTVLPAADAIIAQTNALTEEFLGHISRGIAVEDIRVFERVLAQMRHNMSEINAAR